MAELYNPYRGAGGGGFSDPGVAHFTSTGSGGDGTPDNPYGPGQAQAAYDAGFRNFRVGENCNAGTITITSGGPIDLVIHGANAANSRLDVLYRGGTVNVQAYSCFTQIDVGGATAGGLSEGGSNSGAANVYGDGQVAVYATGGNGGPGDNNTPSGSGGLGGNVFLSGVLVAAVIISGGGPGNDGGAGAGSTGGDGFVTLSGVRNGSLFSNTFQSS